MPRLLEGSVYFTFAFLNAAFIGGQHLSISRLENFSPVDTPSGHCFQPPFLLLCSVWSLGPTKNQSDFENI